MSILACRFEVARLGYRLALLSTIVLFWSLLLHTQESFGADVGDGATISGTVKATNGAPVVGAMVTLLGGRNDVRLRTGEKGEFVFAGLSPATYVIEVEAPQFNRTQSAPFPLTSDQRLVIAVVLQPVSTTTVRTLGRVVISGRNGLNSSSSVAGVTIIADQISAPGNTALTSALDKVPGVSIDRSSYGDLPGGSRAVVFRGAGTNGTQYENTVLEDGEPVQDGSAGGYNIGFQTPAIYSQIEVVKGVGGTSLFGANSIGGTLNFVTRDPLASAGGELQVTAASFGTADINLLATDTNGRFGYLLDHHTYNTDGFAGYKTFDFVPFGVAFSPPSSYTSANAVFHVAQANEVQILRSDLVKLRYALGTNSYVIAAASNTQDFENQTGGLSFPIELTIGTSNYSVDPLGHSYLSGSPGAYFVNAEPKVSLEYHTTIGGGSFVLRTYDQFPKLVNNQQDVPAEFGPFEFLLTNHLSGSIASYTKVLGKHSMTFAAGGYGDRFRNAFSTDPTASFSQLMTVAEGVQIEREYLFRDDAQVSPKLDLTFTNYYSVYTPLNTHRYDPRLGVAFRPDPNQIFRLSIGTGFAAPRLSDIVTPINTQFPTSSPLCPSSEPMCAAISGNPTLKPESAFGIDMGFGQSWPHGGRIDFDLYRSNLTNHIYQDYVPAPAGLTFGPTSITPGAPILFLQQPTNIVRSIYTGIEASAQVALAQHLALSASYNIEAAYPEGLSRTQQSLLQNVINGQQFISVPLHKPNASLGYHNAEYLSADFNWVYYDLNNSYGRPPFSIYGLDAVIPLGESKLTISATNLFDRNNTVFPSGASVFGTVGAFVFTGGPVTPYPGFSGPYPVFGQPSAPTSISVTFERRWGSLR